MLHITIIIVISIRLDVTSIHTFMHMIIESQTCNVFSITYRVTALAEVELIFYRYFLDRKL